MSTKDIRLKDLQNNILHPETDWSLIQNKPAAWDKNYADLINKPQINNVELIGNKTASELGLPQIEGSSLAFELSDSDGNTILQIDSNGDIAVKNFNSADLKPVATTGSYTDLTDKPDLTQYALVSEAGNKVELSMDSTTYILSLKLKDKNGNQLGDTQQVDLPLESVVISGRYDSTTKTLILTLKNGEEISIPLADLVSGLVKDVKVNGTSVVTDGVANITLPTNIETTADNAFEITDDNGNVVLQVSNTGSIQTKEFDSDELPAKFDEKQNVLISGTNIKTVSNKTILGSGNLELTKTDVGLSNVDNTSDLDKPISTATQAALDAKQASLTETQLAAVNSGITSSKVSTYDAYATTKQDTLTETQMAAVNSGITGTKVTAYDAYATTKQDTLTETQLAAVNSGITAEKVTAYDAYETTKQDTLVSGENIKTINNISLLGSDDIALVGDVKVDGTSVVDTNHVANITMPVKTADTDLAFSLSDEENNNLLEINNTGAIQTKTFDSSAITKDNFDTEVVTEIEGKLGVSNIIVDDDCMLHLYNTSSNRQDEIEALRQAIQELQAQIANNA